MTTYRSSSALGEFIRSRRQRLRPEDSGIDPLPGRRRTPGLRREEVAYLANMSVTYYTWLEQGKELNPSQDILSSIGRALQLSESEQSYLFSLAEPRPAAAPASEARSDLPLLQALAGQMRYPCFMTDDSTNILAWNRSVELVLADFGRMPENERHVLHLVFQNENCRKRLANWEAFARYTTAWVRTIFESSKSNPLYLSRFEHLSRVSEDFRRCWDLYEVKEHHVFPVAVNLPDGRGLYFDIHSAGHVDHDPNLVWTIFVPQAGTDTEQILNQLLRDDGDSF